MSSHLQNLNPEQEEAVQHGEGPLLIFAGAGSGKTRVLTRRIANLILRHGAHPDEIFAVTFTNKAANEMKVRIASIFTEQRVPRWVATFHSLCVRILRNHAKEIGYSQNFGIYDTSDSLATLKRVYKKLNVDPRIIDPGMVRSKIDRAKNEYQFSDSIRKESFYQRDFAESIANIFDAYQEELRLANAMDFGDLLCNVVTLFTLEPKILARYQKQFRYLLIDEYQDTNHVQYLLVRMLSQTHENLCVVGDDDQSIYAFRGATIRNILDFRKDYPRAKVVTLDTNYRSTKNILCAANAIIANNRNRQEKRMKTPNPDGNKIVGYRASHERDEADFVVRNITALLRGGLSASEIAIFYRTNAQSRPFEEALCDSGLPYEIYGSLRFYERKEIKDILAYYRLGINSHDNESFLRIVNTPTRGLGATAIGTLINYASKNSLALLPALRQALRPENKIFSGVVEKRWKTFSEILLLLETEATRVESMLSMQYSNGGIGDHNQLISGFIHFIAEKSSYLHRLKTEETPEAESRIENISELMRVATEFSQKVLDEHQTLSLAAFLDRASLASDLDKEKLPHHGDKNDKIEGTVSLMTLHLAKGLEFDAVFLVGLEEGLLPHVRSLESERDLEEERRLLYVGITRARKHLYLSRTTDRQSYGRHMWMSGYPSRFITELPEEALDDLNRFRSDY